MYLTLLFQVLSSDVLVSTLSDFLFPLVPKCDSFTSQTEGSEGRGLVSLEDGGATCVVMNARDVEEDLRLIGVCAS